MKKLGDAAIESLGKFPGIEPDNPIPLSSEPFIPEPIHCHPMRLEMKLAIDLNN